MGIVGGEKERKVRRVRPQAEDGYKSGLDRLF